MQEDNESFDEGCFTKSPARCTASTRILVFPWRSQCWRNHPFEPDGWMFFYFLGGGQHDACFGSLDAFVIFCAIASLVSFGSPDFDAMFRTNESLWCSGVILWMYEDKIAGCSSRAWNCLSCGLR